MDLALLLDRPGIPLHRQLYDALRQAILSGQLQAGERLPSTRALAQSLGISRGTVKLGYEQLLDEGYLETATGSGTFVAPGMAAAALTAVPSPSPSAATAIARRLSQYGQNLSPLPAAPPAPPDINFCHWQPAFGQLPLPLWRQLTARQLQTAEWLDYSTEPAGYPPLRAAIARYLARSRAVRCTPEQVIIVSGTQQALDLIARLFVDPGDRIIMEEPGYLSARQVFQSQGGEICPVPVDRAGLQVERLPTAGKPAKLLYVTPSHQFPTGAILSLPRRLALLAQAQQQGTLVIEDDYDSEYRYAGKPIPAMQGLDRGEAVIYSGTFSKVLCPGLRIAYLVVPPDLIDRFTGAKRLLDRHAPLLEQGVLTEFIECGHLGRHLRRMRALYDRRRQALVRALREQLGDRVTTLGAAAGIHLLVQLQTAQSDAEMLARAARVGVGLTSAAPFYMTQPSRGQFLLGYANLTEAQIADGIRRWAQVLEPP